MSRIQAVLNLLSVILIGGGLIYLMGSSERRPVIVGVVVIFLGFICYACSGAPF